MQRRAGWWGLFLLGTAACGDSARVLAPGGSGRICPSCLSGIGGETSDFGSDSQSGCSYGTQPLPAEWDARVAEIRSVYEGPFEANARWDDLGARSELGSPYAFWRAVPSGYEPVAGLSGHVALGAPEFWKGSSAYPELLECPDQVHFPATVELATADGSLAGTATGQLWTSIGLFAELDLAEAVGTLDLHLDPRLDYRGKLTVSLSAFPEGMHGALYVAVDTAEEYEGRFVGYEPLHASFPDECAGMGIQGRADTPLTWLEGKTLSESLLTWSTAVMGLTPAGVRQDCAPGSRDEAPVEVSFELGAPEADLCHTPAWPAMGLSTGTVFFQSSARLRTSDGRIDTPLVHGVLTRNSLKLHSPDEAAVIPAQQFAELTGIQGVDVTYAEAFDHSAQVEFTRQEGALQSSGQLIVYGLACSHRGDCQSLLHTSMHWPVDYPSRPSCRL